MLKAFFNVSIQTHSQAVVCEEAGYTKASLDGVWLRVGSWIQRLEIWSWCVRQIGLRADVKVLCLESCESSQAVGNLEAHQNFKQTTQSNFTNNYIYLPPNLLMNK